MRLSKPRRQGDREKHGGFYFELLREYLKKHKKAYGY
jgi:hypothetical protein